MVAALPGLLGENPTLAVETNFGFEIFKNRSFFVDVFTNFVPFQNMFSF